MVLRPAAPPAGLAGEVRRYVEEVEGSGEGLTVHLYFEDLSSGAFFGIRATRPVLAGSTVKVPLVLFLYRLAAAGLLDLGERMSLTEEDFAGTGEEPVEAGVFTLRDLAVSSLQVSENVAANALFRRLGRANVYAFMRDLGAKVIPRGPGMGNVTSARDAALYLKALLRFQFEHPRFGQEPLAFLYDTPFRERLVAYLPPELRVAHKVGTYRDVVADAGIFFLAGRPYVLSVFVRHPWRSAEDEARAERVVAELSHLVYRHMSAPAPRGAAPTVDMAAPAPPGAAPASADPVLALNTRPSGSLAGSDLHGGQEGGQRQGGGHHRQQKDGREDHHPHLPRGAWSRGCCGSFGDLFPALPAPILALAP